MTRTKLLVLAAAVVIALGAAAVPSCATRESEVPDGEYWTPERIRDAEPAPVPGTSG
ncbi:hypothetical protein CLV63_10467 [Murinocardiopsis flavida]|uniref:Uncharacterized protein n=1 Tax=Murinocardiopsis flavida TaxID=645275 RepID=A0A2P8DNR2_9ACTN|nr:hypothetical protein [Murinocardiopsis flavida]PSK98843.1 hypothetical protein CLV63_10467 [Murinocardiopsis flavida]